MGSFEPESEGFHHQVGVEHFNDTIDFGELLQKERNISQKTVSKILLKIPNWKASGAPNSAKDLY